MGYRAHIRTPGEKKLLRDRRQKPRSWVVERTRGWLNRVRGMLTRLEKRAAKYFASSKLLMHTTHLKEIMVFGSVLSYLLQNTRTIRYMDDEWVGMCIKDRRK